MLNKASLKAGFSLCFILGLVGFSVSQQVLVQDCPRPSQVTRLVEDDPSTSSGQALSLSKGLALEDLGNREGRTPLILIHGIFGTEDLNKLSDTYWKNFLGYFKSTPALHQKFKVYRFHYLSNKCPVSELAQGLGQQIDRMIRRGKLEDKQFVILAHSMGGLIARAYMSTYDHRGIGNYSGQPGGERVLKLITLATPHHGAPAANKNARDALATQSAILYGWLDALKFSDIAYWCSGGLSSCNNALAPDIPNRADLRYDNFDNALPSSQYNISSERNDWLIQLNSKNSKSLDRRYDEKIIAYYGYIDPGDPYRLYLSDWYEGSSRITGVLNPIISFPYATIFNSHLGLIASNVLLDVGLSHAFPLNDGLVPVLSGSFYGYNVGGRRSFIGHDHLDMKDGKVDKFGEIPLFRAIENDLLNLTTRAIISVVSCQSPIIRCNEHQTVGSGQRTLRPSSEQATDNGQQLIFPALTPITFSGTASTFDLTQNIISYFWDFGDGLTGTGEVVEHSYLTPGTYKVSLTIQTTLGDKNTATVTVDIRNPQINTVPRDAWTRKFSIPESPLVTSYSWDFGDGTPPVHVPSTEHAYGKGGYYKVTLTLTTHTGSKLQSTTNVTIGTGPTVIPEGTISSNETWLSIGSPYLIQGPVTVAEGAVLTLEPGTLLKFSPGASLLVKGSLKAEGTNARKIVFTSYRDFGTWGHGDIEMRGHGDGNTGMNNDFLRPRISMSSHLDLPAPGDWGQIYFFNTSVDSVLSNTIIQYGHHNIQISGSSPRIVHSVIRDGAGDGIYLSGGSKAVLSENLIAENQNGITVLASSPDITHNTFKNNQGVGLLVDDVSSPKITNNVFNGNEVALDITYGQDMAVILVDNKGLTVKDIARVRGTISSNTLWNNHIIYTVDKTGLTIAPAGVLTLAPGSIVKGHPESFFDVYGMLLADGTDTRKVIFTSIKDDAFGGDTNRDGDASKPTPGDWKGIIFRQAQGRLPSTGSGQAFSDISLQSVLRHCIIQYVDAEHTSAKTTRAEDEDRWLGAKRDSLFPSPPPSRSSTSHNTFTYDAEEEIYPSIDSEAIPSLYLEQALDPGNRHHLNSRPGGFLLDATIFDSGLQISNFELSGQQPAISSPQSDNPEFNPTPVQPVSTPIDPVATPIERTLASILSETPSESSISTLEPPELSPVISLINPVPVTPTPKPSTPVPSPVPSDLIPVPTPEASETPVPVPSDSFLEISETPTPIAIPGTPTPTPSLTPVTISWGTGGDVPVPQDYDGDDQADPAVWRPNDGLWFWQSSSSGELSIEPWGAEGDTPVPADYDGDGRSDIAVWRARSQKWLIKYSSSGTSTTQQGRSVDSPLPADYDGDGIADMALWQPSAKRWGIKLGSAEKLIAYRGIELEDIPLPKDYDGDGKADIAIWRPRNGNWYISFSSSVGLLTLSWGLPEDIPVPADYDGDGRADIAIWRPSEGVWYILQSTGGILTQSLGMFDDIPVPADYDGDGKDDIAVWRPQNGTWYILPSSRNLNISVIQLFGYSTENTP